MDSRYRSFILDPNSPECSTPLMKQFLNLKEQVGDAFLFFRMGDFYELFGEDAILAAPILGITLTSRDRKSENPVPMAGLPYHSSTNYIQKLLNAGKKVAIAEQILPEGMTTDQIKGIVERKIIRIFTPAVQFEMNEKGGQNFLATLAPDLSKPNSKNHVLAMLDPATGILRLSESLPIHEILAEPMLGQIKHFLNHSSKTPIELLDFISSLPHTLVEDVPHNWVSEDNLTSFLHEQYEKKALHPLLNTTSAQKAAAILIQYTLKTQGLKTLSHLHEPTPLHESHALSVGPHTHSHLDTPDLFTLINQTATSMGARHLRDLLNAPYKDVAVIANEQEAVKELTQENLSALQIHGHLKNVYDLDRILGRISARLAHPRDTYALGKSLEAAFLFEDRLSRFQSKRLKKLSAQLSEACQKLSPLSERILKTQRPDAPIHTREGGIFEIGTDPELDRLLLLTEKGEKFIIDLEMREREVTGIGSLKVKYNRVFGYFFEISSANLKNVPAHYQRKQTMVGGERFFTEELKKFEEEILSASSKQKALEAALFQKLIDDLLLQAEALKNLAAIMGELDSLLSRSFLGLKSSWAFPTIDESFIFDLKGSRHPVVDEALRGQFVPNDLFLSPETARTLMITGPNMGGKSTVMRQMAQIILLGQMGAPVPATQAHWGVFHSLYTRIGAHDAIAKGQSTFMVEMVELGHILSHANERSFVVLDEIGRGTSTYDGMSVARASLEYLHTRSHARIVFATHYHEMTELEASLPGLKNAFMKVLDEKGKLTFLYELALGRSSKSFGIQVAELAGLPKPVIKHAWSILKELEAQSLNHPGTGAFDSGQLSLFSQAPLPSEAAPEDAAISSGGALPGLRVSNASLISLEISSELEALDLNQLRPIEALNVLADLQKRLRS